MKKIASIMAGLALFASCYDDYVKDNDFNAVYFSYQTDVRTVVVGEGMEFKTGIVLAGVIENKQDRKVEFVQDDALVTPAVLADMKNHSFSYIKAIAGGMSNVQPMPAGMYSINPTDKVTIKKGQHHAEITIKIDSLAFLSDPLAALPEYCIGFNILKADADLILEGKESTVIGVRYDNMLFGNYWHGGHAIGVDASGAERDRIEYYTEVPQPDNRSWTLTTVSPFELSVNGIANEIVTSQPQFILRQDGGRLTLTDSGQGTYPVEQDGECSFNQAPLLQDRKLFLQYKFEKDGLTYHATDTLTFRNRIRDGINEWQDENQSNY
ncbi:MAG: DUF1735 domain-containing protein [Alistipes sp.]|nr:DUF1735 domain-containing protein [Alistipes sp.]